MDEKDLLDSKEGLATGCSKGRVLRSDRAKEVTAIHLLDTMQNYQGYDAKRRTLFYCSFLMIKLGDKPAYRS